MASRVGHPEQPACDWPIGKHTAPFSSSLSKAPAYSELFPGLTLATSLVCKAGPRVWGTTRQAAWDLTKAIPPDLECGL